MYERSAIVLERCFEKLFKFSQEGNLKTNYMNFSEIVEQIKEYQETSIEEENVIEKFDEIAVKIENIQKRQTTLYESNIKLEEERNKLFNDLGENPNALDSKLHYIEKTLNENNEELIKLREEYVEALVIFIERQKERNKYSRLRRKVEAEHRNNIKNASNEFEKIDPKEVQAIKKFINIDKEQYKEKIINTMIKNGKNEKIPFNNQVIEKAVEARIDISEKEAELYVSVYERMKKLLLELESENVKLSKSEKLLRDVSVKLNFLNAKKEYIVGFLDNERLTVINGKDAHKALMEEACENFELDIKQIDNLYELIMRETTGKSTKKAYNELYNKTYLRDIEQKERKFEQEITNLKVNMGTVINSNYWRIEGIKNVYNVFQEEITEKFEKDLSEYQIEEIEEEIYIDDEDENNYYNEDTEDENEYYQSDEETENDDKDYDYDYDYDYEDYDYDYDNEDYEEDDDDYYDDEDDYEEDDDDDYDYDDDDYEDDYDEDEDDDYYDEEYDDEEDSDEDTLEDKMDEIIKKSKNKSKDKKEERKEQKLLNKWFKKKNKIMLILLEIFDKKNKECYNSNAL